MQPGVFSLQTNNLMTIQTCSYLIHIIFIQLSTYLFWGLSVIFWFIFWWQRFLWCWVLLMWFWCGNLRYHRFFNRIFFLRFLYWYYRFWNNCLRFLYWYYNFWNNW